MPTSEDANELRHALTEALSESGVIPDGSSGTGSSKAASPSSKAAWMDTLLKAVQKRCSSLLSGLADPSMSSSEYIQATEQRITERGVPREEAYSTMWRELKTVFGCTTLSTHLQELRSQKPPLLVIGPGFGLLKTPAQIEMIKAAGYQVKEVHPSPVGFSDPQQVDLIVRAINKHKPSAVLCASKGGAYMLELWKRMSAHPSDPKRIAIIPCLMINAYSTDVTCELGPSPASSI